MTRCTQCGEQAEGDYCKHCGNKLNENNTKLFGLGAFGLVNVVGAILGIVGLFLPYWRVQADRPYCRLREACEAHVDEVSTATEDPGAMIGILLGFLLVFVLHRVSDDYGKWSNIVIIALGGILFILALASIFYDPETFQITPLIGTYVWLVSGLMIFVSGFKNTFIGKYV